MPGGRPTKYGSKILKQAGLYLVNFEQMGDLVPSVAGLSCYLGVSRDTIYEWAKETKPDGTLAKPQFSDIVKELMSTQEKILLAKGLAGIFNPTITKLVMAKHGYKEKVDTTTNDKDLPTPIFANIPLKNELPVHNGNGQNPAADEED